MQPSPITTNALRQWGTPCIRDTGITVRHLVDLHLGGRSIRAILDVHPDLTPEDVDAALEWYLDHGTEGLGPRPPAPGDPRIVVDPEIQGGVPTILGTRVTVDAVVAMWKAGCDLRTILDTYPVLERPDVQAAVAYAAGVGV